MVKIKNKFNPSDQLTKYLTKAEVQSIMEHIQSMFETGRPKAAPKLAITDEQPTAHDSELHVICAYSNVQTCYCNGYGIAM